MKLSTKIVRMIIALAVAALAGLIVLQAILLHTALQTKEQTFRRNVLAALNAACQSLETSEAAGHSVMAFMTTIDGTQIRQQMSSQIITAGDSVLFDTSSCVTLIDSLPPARIVGDTLYYNVTTPQQVKIQIYNPDHAEKRITIDTFRIAGDYGISLDSLSSPSGAYVYSMELDGQRIVRRIETVDGHDVTFCDLPPGEGKIVLVQRVLGELLDAERRPVTDRFDKTKLDAVIATALTENGVDLPFTYGVLSGENDSLVLAEPTAQADRLRQSEFKARLFPQDVFSIPGYLVVHFPDQGLYLWRQMLPLLSATILFMGIIIICFAYTARVMFSQRRFAGRLIDFINNMTHEFKTPLSTVALASEAISRPDVVSEPDKIARFNRMIADENLRMRHQVDKILQMAVLEEGDYELTLVEVNLHDVIRKAVENVALAVEARQGKISCDLQADQPVVVADRVHAANIIHNLLDNANKYSPETPSITVATHDAPGGVAISIRDHGIGISDVDKKQVFDKYFRVPSGNIHDIKGFGLGLSYVRLMVAAHGGTIALQSRLGEGTTVELFFPQTGPKEPA